MRKCSMPLWTVDAWKLSLVSCGPLSETSVPGIPDRLNIVCNVSMVAAPEAVLTGMASIHLLKESTTSNSMCLSMDPVKHPWVRDQDSAVLR